MGIARTKLSHSRLRATSNPIISISARSAIANAKRTRPTSIDRIPLLASSNLEYTSNISNAKKRANITSGEYLATGQRILNMDAISAQQIPSAPAAAAPFMNLMKITSPDIGIYCSLTCNSRLLQGAPGSSTHPARDWRSPHALQLD